MKQYSGKTLDDALAKAANDLHVNLEDLNYIVTEEKKSFFSKKVEIDVFLLSDVIDFACHYLSTLLDNSGLTKEISSKYEDGIIRIVLNTDHNSILIGKNGRTLQNLNELVRIATNNTFKRRFRILLDINAYKDDKYEKVIRIAKRVAKDVMRTKVTAKLDPMPADERRMVHNALSEFKNIKTESIGQGNERQLTIKYIGD